MKCQNCGAYIKRRDTFCPHCGEEVKKSPYKSYKKGNNSEYKPLQQRFMRGEYQDQHEDFYDQYIEEQFIDERPAYQEPKKKKYRGYDLSEYYPDEEETKGSKSSMLPIVLILLIALLIGFIIGVMVFSNNLQSLTNIG